VAEEAERERAREEEELRVWTHIIFSPDRATVTAVFCSTWKVFLIPSSTFDVRPPCMRLPCVRCAIFRIPSLVLRKLGQRAIYGLYYSTFVQGLRLHCTAFLPPLSCQWTVGALSCAVACRRRCHSSHSTARARHDPNGNPYL